MTYPTLDFSDPALAQRLSAAPDEQLDALDFGVVEMNYEGLVLRYNATESRYSGLAVERVVGRHFFTEVATCGNNRKVAHRYAEPVLDETIAYTFALRMKPIPVTLRLLKAEGLAAMYMLVRWS